MRIAIFTDTFYPNIDGVVTATLSLAKGLADRGHKIYIIAPRFKNYKDKFWHKNIKIIRISSWPAFFYKGHRMAKLISLWLIKYLRKEKIDIIHFQTPVILNWQAIIIGATLKIPIIGTFHTFFTDPQYLEHIKMNNPYFEKVAWFYARKCYNACDLVTCPSESTKRELLANGIIKKIKVISNGVDEKIFDNTNYKKIIKKYNLNDKTLLFIGRLAYEKNIHYLLDCFKLVTEEIPEAKLLIIGEGPQRKEIEVYINQLNLSNNVILTGKIEHKELIKSGIFKACKIFTTASLTENQPMTMLEAQTNGMVCVGIKARGVCDLIRHNYNGKLAEQNSKRDFAEKVIMLLKDERLYKKMSQNTLKEIRKHSLKNVLDTWEKEYKKLIASKDTSPNILDKLSNDKKKVSGLIKKYEKIMKSSLKLVAAIFSNPKKL